MHNNLASAALVAGLITAGLGSAQAADVGVSIGISQPGVYGRVDIGRFPQPEVLVAQPVLVRPSPVYVQQGLQPVYLWVPPAHRRHWARYCYRYNACGTPVYFVKEDWYHRHVAPAPQWRRPLPPPPPHVYHGQPPRPVGWRDGGHPPQPQEHGRGWEHRGGQHADEGRRPQGEH
jgi:hypothetical protein